MTFSEFEYWLEGLKEGMHGKPPTKMQWKKIQKKLKEVAPGPHYQWPYYHHYIDTRPVGRPITYWTSETDTWGSTSIPCNFNTTDLTFTNGTTAIETNIPYTLTSESMRC